MKIVLSPVYTLICLSVFFCSTLLSAETVDGLLNASEEPEGVVFEVVSGDDDLLKTLLPSIIKDIERLRLRYPQLPVAVVTHGSEQFALLGKNRQKSAETHNLVQQLISQQQVDVHVCGTYAEWKGYDESDFPGYVNVATAGPVQINDYVKLGYSVITLP